MVKGADFLNEGLMARVNIFRRFWWLGLLVALGVFLLREVRLRGSPWVCSLAVTNDGKTVAAGTGDGRVLVWDLNLCRLSGAFWAAKDPVTALAFLDVHGVLATATQRGEVALWKRSSLEPVERVSVDFSGLSVIAAKLISGPLGSC